jgi:hypothetical protein
MRCVDVDIAMKRIYGVSGRPVFKKSAIKEIYRNEK